MKKFLMTTAFVAASTGIAPAQDAVNVIRDSAVAQEIYASDLIGMRVYREEGAATADGYAGVQTNWENVGDIGDIILSREGEVQAVIIDVGGFLGIGETPVAVQMDAIRFVQEDGTDNPDDYFLVLNVPRSVFEGAQPYDRAAMTSNDALAPATDGTMATDTAAADPAMGADTTVVTDTDMATAETDLTQQAMDANDGYVETAAADLTSEELTGVAVYGPNDEHIGEVSDIVLTADGQVQAAVVDVGGFLGIGEKPVQLDFADVNIMKQQDGDDLRIHVAMTKEQLEALPEHEG